MLDKKFSWNKVPAIGLLFWATKLISTGQGESISDFSAGIFGHGNQVLSTAFTLIWSIALFVFFLRKQLKSDRYRPFYYWLSVALLAVFGTIFADGLTAVFGLSHLIVTLIFLVLMVLSFASWYFVTGNLSIHKIMSLKSELFYWLTVMFSFALGTAAGDWLAYPMGLGLLNTGLLLGVVFLFIVGFRYFVRPRENSFIEILSFWAAYALTRPIGASFADYFGYKWLGGILGNKGMSLVWLILFIGLMIVMLVREHRDKHVENLLLNKKVDFS
ncbi:hypothetical protein ACFO26_02140 [Lactococcus nasutitermitis]|uniref:Integral membrane protein n=1 Tax=Lactococcus nasutitermitis TaxID=1652957 RepID=A0ABV9JA54_9LACT|nr:hypothetical protein [Lactococcus nasutitermitis]